MLLDKIRELTREGYEVRFLPAYDDDLGDVQIVMMSDHHWTTQWVSAELFEHAYAPEQIVVDTLDIMAHQMEQAPEPVE